MSRVVALDHGSARCGVASCDPTRTIVTPLDPIARPDSKEGLGEVARVISDLEPEVVVVGLPLSLDGKRTSQTDRAEGFAAKLRGHRFDQPIEVVLWDERLTTSAAQKIGGRSSEDSRAAAVLLERWLSVQERP